MSDTPRTDAAVNRDGTVSIPDLVDLSQELERQNAAFLRDFETFSLRNSELERENERLRWLIESIPNP